MKCWEMGLEYLATDKPNFFDWNIYWDNLDELAKIVASNDRLCTLGMMSQSLSVFIGQIDGIEVIPPVNELIGGRLGKLLEQAQELYPIDTIAQKEFYELQAIEILREYNIPESQWS